MNALTVITALLSALANAASLVLQRRASVVVAPVPGHGVRASVRRFIQPLTRVMWWCGALATLLSAAFQVIALDNGALSVVQPLLASELLFSLLLGAIVFGQRPSGALWRAFIMLAWGLALFLVAASPSGGRDTAPDIRWFAAGCVLAGVLVTLILTALRVRGTLRSAVLGAATAVGYATTAALIKEVTARFPGGAEAVLTTWHTYVAAAVGLLSVLLLQWALRAGSLTGSQPALTLGDAALSVALGVFLFGETINLGWHVLTELLGMALIGYGVYGLTGVHAATAGEADWDDAPPGVAREREQS